MTLRERAAALFDVVDAYRDRECRAAIERAEREAAAMVRRAHGGARRRVHEAVVGERERAMTTLRAAQAELHTARRNDRRRRDLALLGLAWPRLAAALQRRWDESESRRQWIAGVVATAQRRLPIGPWDIHHPSEWPTVERDAFIAQVTALCGTPPRLVVDPEISAGLMLTSGTATLDGSITGLLADRSAVAARLLALLEGDDLPPVRGETEPPLPLSPSHKGEGGHSPTAGQQAPSPLEGEGRGEGDGTAAQQGDRP